jgi:uncharacterized protein YgbK (DUF1537 family)
MNDLLLTYYGDDLTGSTDVMEALVLGGVPTALFFEPPTSEQISRDFPEIRAVGVAGISRSLSPDQMEYELPSRFAALKALNAPLFHYKICSTFDSSPDTGSIGRACDIGWRIFEPTVVPLLVGAPSLKRYVIFSNLFARVGDVTYRLDRHPTMSKHPITPMSESDLRVHLGKQTALKVGAIDILHLAKHQTDIERQFEELVEDGAHIILFDTLDQTHLLIIGQLIWDRHDNQPKFVVGSSGIEYALTAHWQSIDLIKKSPALQPRGIVDPVIVIAGSASPVTASQIQWALENGFSGIRLNASQLVDPSTADQERETVVEEALQVLNNKSSVVIYSAQGPDDPAIVNTQTRVDQIGLKSGSIGERLGTQQGLILQSLLQRSAIRRVCVAGGDTSGYAARQLGIYALEIATPIAPGAPLCRARSHYTLFDGLEISLKGGQNGERSYFGSIRQGHVLP